jgi:hypothetical protein
VTLAHQAWGICSSPASLSYHAPRFGVSTGLCALWAWISMNRKACPGSHYATQVAFISGAHPENPISQCAASRLAREEGAYSEAQAPVDLTSLL